MNGAGQVRLRQIRGADDRADSTGMLREPGAENPRIDLADRLRKRAKMPPTSARGALNGTGGPLRFTDKGHDLRPSPDPKADGVSDMDIALPGTAILSPADVLM